NALMNGHAISDEAVISRMAMAAVTVVMILSVIVYVKCANKPVWYDRLMIGGSVVMALVRVLMGVYEGICEGVNMNECVRVRVRVRMMAVMIAVMMAIASVVAVINGGNEKNDGVYVSKNAGRIAKNVIVVVSTCVMAITEWVVQRMGVDVDVSNEVNNEMLQ
ncbi:hypothetical protein HK407_11g16660, partial [Ordospora pajunii]|uniref:uncharacterized protein n=1 Tax=Ordospora pajunii TaxID=3039483 RepID=UPI0029528B7D